MYISQAQASIFAFICDIYLAKPVCHHTDHSRPACGLETPSDNLADSFQKFFSMTARINWDIFKLQECHDRSERKVTLARLHSRAAATLPPINAHQRRLVSLTDFESFLTLLGHWAWISLVLVSSQALMEPKNLHLQGEEFIEWKGQSLCT